MGKIEDLGLEEKIIEARNRGDSIAEISRQHKLHRKTITAFLRSPTAIMAINKPLERKVEHKIEATQSSIFNVAQYLEENSAVLRELKKEHEAFREVFNELAGDALEIKGNKAPTDRTKLSWFKEYRKQVELSAKLIQRMDEQIKLAVDITRNLVAFDRAEQFRRILIEEIGKESEDVKNRILQRMYNVKLATGLSSNS